MKAYAEHGESSTVLPHEVGWGINTLRNLSRIALNRRLFRTDDGKLGLAYKDAKPLDIVCIIHRSKTPLILRKLSSGKYVTGGQCYLEGAMCGEMVDWGKEDADEFVLV